MLSASAIQRVFAALMLSAGLFATGCGKKAEPTGKQKVIAKVDGATDDDYDEGGYPIDRNRKDGVGDTRVNDDGTEELIIPVRERFFEDDPVMPREVGAMPRVEVEQEFDEDGWSNFFRNRNTGVGSTRVNDNGTEELIIPLRELKK